MAGHSLEHLASALERRKMRRSELQEEQEITLKAFLRAHRFSDVNEPRQAPRCLPLKKPEQLWPLHVAAQRGDAEVVRLLLKQGADPEQRTSRQRTAQEIAQAKIIIIWTLTLIYIYRYKKHIYIFVILDVY